MTTVLIDYYPLKIEQCLPTFVTNSPKARLITEATLGP